MSSQVKANKRYEDKLRSNPQTHFELKRKKSLTQARSYVRNYATTDGLDELDLLIKEKRKEL